MEEIHIQRVISRFQDANAQDPNKVEFEGEFFPRELLYSSWLSEWIDKLSHNPSPSLRLASYSQHLKRWEIPRDTYPMDRSGYLKWRTRLYDYHADQATSIMEDEKVPPEIIENVRKIILKKDRKSDPEVQIMEDALCLVTLQYQIEDFSRKYSDEKITSILEKVIKKMSKEGIEHSLSLNYSPRIGSIIKNIIHG